MTHDSVKHPSHYTSRDVHCRECDAAVECIQVTESFNFNLGNAVKYLWRAGSKGNAATELIDLHKAKQYIEFEIERRSRELARHFENDYEPTWEGAD